MTKKKTFDWHNASEAEHLDHVRRATPAQRNEIIRAYDWAFYPEAVLGWATAQKTVDLGAALVAFFNGDPSRFNYLPKQDIGPEHRGTLRLLDSISQRINAGFYLPSPLACAAKIRKLDNWLYYQDQDVKDGRRGRWVFDRQILSPALPPEPARITDEDAALLNPELLPGHHTPVVGESLILKAFMRPATGN